VIDNERLYSVVSSILGVPIDDVNDTSSPDNFENWGSLTHINLVVAIEAEFNVSFTPEDTMDMLSVKLIRMVLEDKVNEK